MQSNYLKHNGIFGLCVGVSLVIANLAFYLTDKNINMNPQLMNTSLLLLMGGIFIGVRKYRDTYLEGNITYGKAVGVSMFIITCATILNAIFIYILYKSDNILIENYLTETKEIILTVYKDTPIANQITPLLETFMTAGTIAFSDMINKIIYGFFFSLFIAIILKKSTSNL